MTGILDNDNLISFLKKNDVRIVTKIRRNTTSKRY